ncbi:MAG TPA: hypothetical protein VEA59_04665 [Patescibacteria group bacterium]|nr:hypothetical protein [Patescibacteria group bacterium]
MSLAAEQLKLNLFRFLIGFVRLMKEFPRWQRYLIFASVLLFLPILYSTRAYATKYFNETYAPLVVTVLDPTKDALLPEVTQLRIAEYAAGQFSAYAIVSNPNLVLHLRTGNYKVSFFDGGNSLMHETKGQLYLLAGKDKYLVVSRIPVKTKPAKMSVEFSSLSWVKTNSIRDIDFAKQPTSIHNELDPIRTVVDGGFLNTSGFDLPNVSVQVILKDAQGYIKTISERHESSVEPKEQRTFRILYPGLFASPGTKAEVILDTNPFEAE